MSDSGTVVSYSAPGFLPLLTLLFVGLKLGGIIDWSWWWVLSPMWIPFAILGVFLAIASFLYLLSVR